MTLTRSDRRGSARGLPQRKEAFGRVPLALTWDNWDIRDTVGTTQRDIIAVRVGHGMSYPAPSLLVVHNE